MPRLIKLAILNYLLYLLSTLIKLYKSQIIAMFMCFTKRSLVITSIYSEQQVFSHKTIVLMAIRVTRLGNFSPVRQAHLRNSPKMAIPWATNLLHFHLNKPFKKWYLFWQYCILATLLATFQKIGRFFPNHLVTLMALDIFGFLN